MAQDFESLEQQAHLFIDWKNTNCYCYNKDTICNKSTESTSKKLHSDLNSILAIRNRRQKSTNTSHLLHHYSFPVLRN